MALKLTVYKNQKVIIHSKPRQEGTYAGCRFEGEEENICVHVVYFKDTDTYVEYKQVSDLNSATREYTVEMVS